MVWVLTMMLLSGCWDRMEINDLAIVSAIGVDSDKDNKLLVSLQIAIPLRLGTIQSGGGGGGKSTYVISDTGDTFSEAFRKIQMRMPREIFFSQSRVLLIGEDLAKKGVNQILDFHSRYHEPRINTYIMFTKGKATDILKNEPKFENVPAEETKELVKLGVGLSVMIRDFENMLHEEGREPFAPKFDTAALLSNKKDSSEKVQVINGAAIFKNDKLIGWMDDIETRGILWIRNKMKSAVITFDVPEDHGGGKVSAEIYGARSKMEPVIKKGKLKMNISVDVVLGIIENDSMLKLDKTKEIELLNKCVAKEITDRMRLTLDKAQKDLQSDIFGFGVEVYKKYPKEWNSKYRDIWEQEFSQMEVSIQPSIHVRRIGLSTK